MQDGTEAAFFQAGIGCRKPVLVPSPVRPPLPRNCSGRCCGPSLLGNLGKEFLDRNVLPVADAGETLVGDELIDAEEETEPRDSLPTPELPSKSEIDDHNIDHCPYRSWCRFCVEGRAREMAHRLQDPGSRKIATISFDYLFVTRRNVFTREEWDAEKSGETFLKVLVVCDSKSKATFAHGVPAKGLDDRGFIVRCIADDVGWLGYSKVVLKCDNEPAIVAVLREALKAIRIDGVDQAMEEHPPPYDSQANGKVEAAVKSVRGMTRTLQVALEDQLQSKIPTTHPVMHWLVSHAADVLTWRIRGPDGLTAYQRARGKPFTYKLIAFGERCNFKFNSKAPIGESDRWNFGIYVGRDRLNGQHILFNPASGEVCKARTIMRLPDVQKWCRDSVAKISATPFSIHIDQGPDVVFQKKEGVAEPPRQEATLSRRVYMSKKDFDDFGYTSGCPRCDHELRYGPGRTSRPHSERCRDRIMAELAKTELGRLRLGLAAERMERTVAEHIDQHDDRRALAQGEKVDDMRDVPPVVPARDPFQTSFEPLQTDDGGVEALPSSSLEPMVEPPEQVCDTGSVPPRLTAQDGGMDIDMVVASDFDGRGSGQLVGTSGSRIVREVEGRSFVRSDEATAAPPMESGTGLTPTAMPVHQDACDIGDPAMGEIVDDVERLRGAKPVVETHAEVDCDVGLN